MPPHARGHIFSSTPPTLDRRPAMRHPLEPLTAAGGPAGRPPVASPGKVTPTTRFVSVSLKEPPKAARPRPSPAARPSRARRSPSCSTTPRTPATRRPSRSPTASVLVVEARPRRAADHDHRRAGRVRAGRAGQPGVQGRARRSTTASTTRSLVMVDIWSAGNYGDARRTARAGWPGRSASCAPTRPTTATPGPSRACGPSSI